jgi:competence protein ComGC
MAQYLANKKMRGLTIVQTMVILLVVGILGSVLVDYIIDKRCEAEPSREMCASRQ